MKIEAKNDISELLTAIASSVSFVWNYQLAYVDGDPITVGKIIIAIALAILGYFLSLKISKQMKSRVLSHFGMTLGASTAIESLVFYILLAFFLLFSLKLANVPLTIFTVLGGAAAIGIGFGSQNIMNNFISGLIMLIEQPIRPGDIIEVDGLVGIVSKIGPRSTIIRRGNNIDIILPNSSLLEKNVINWTLSNDKVRLNVSIGVAYGTQTRKVEELLLAAVKSHSKVLSDPSPFVWFVEFGDNALIFEVHFWARIRETGHRSQIESDIRFEIDKLFREAEISIAFPQRDVHLDTIRPLEVKIMGKD